MKIDIKRTLVRVLLLVIMALAPVAPCHAIDDSISWTEEELAFMEAHPVICLGVDPKFVPFEFIDDDGEHKGIAADYLALISKKIGLQFEIQKGLTWPEAYDLALARELDVLPSIGKTLEREQYFLFSEPYYYFKRVIATKDSDVNITGLDDLEGSTVAVQRNSSHHSYMLAFKNINLSLYDSVDAALTAVASGEEKAFIGNLATTNYLIRTNGLTNLRFVAFEAEKQQALYFAVRKDFPELVSIFNKSLTLITEQERNEINNRWIHLDTRLDYGPIIRIIIGIAAFFGTILAVSFFWIARLHREVNFRKKVQSDLENANHQIDLTNKDLQKANEELEKISMMDGLTGVSNRRYFDNILKHIWGINMREKFPLALIMIDIDHFKLYNDTYGHLAGDQCLKIVAKAIDDTVKRAGDFVARFGGEEFVVLLTNTIEDQAAALAERIRVKVEGLLVEYQELKTVVTVGIGVAAITTHKAMGPKDLIKSADIALYQAKAEGRNRIAKASLPLVD